MRSLVTALIALTLPLIGCVHVKPYEREYLSRPSMDPKTETGETRFQAHVRESREGSTASSGAAGGGCGCN
ncbi:MAG: lipoprotein [Myxococcaceae bacterium]|nr:lipoprotein [Myxococcaceae bacterium]